LPVKNPPEKAAVGKSLGIGTAEGDIVVLREPAIVKLEAAAQMEAEVLVQRLRDEAVIPAGA
jgi:hypothetical protein